ncbi:hypothetical protein [Amycolatopsis sp. lyj-109]|uniref:hypothetical protein n=1 Tax=Amycolatopsis sp. lyj-109 TaxID=2789287 RepID=UPI003978FF85
MHFGPWPVRGQFPWDPPGWTSERRDFMLAEPVMIGPAGEVEVPQWPGPGIELDEKALRRWRI